jgi:hypothetical protein
LLYVLAGGSFLQVNATPVKTDGECILVTLVMYVWVVAEPAKGLWTIV